MLRRHLILALAATAAGYPAGIALARTPAYAPVVRGHRLRFPRDHGMHPDFRIEWWYITGWLEVAGRSPGGNPDGATAAGPFGYQITFFRARTRHAAANPSRFAPRQLLLGHAAIADPALGRLRHDQQAWRVGELASVATDDTRIRLPGWTLGRDADDSYLAEVDADGFGYSLRLANIAPPVLQGDDGYSRKGPRPEQASYYYSRPGMRATGTLRIGKREYPVRGSGWLDHEWSSELMPEGAVGWDWAGIGLHDGGSLLAFRLRDGNGQAVHSHGRLRAADGDQIDAPPTFEPIRFWESPRTGIRYPVEWNIKIDDKSFLLTPLFDDQELDARRSSGTIYWEGAVSASLDGRIVGRGYLELTGYGAALDL
ncbi:MAG: carotenoid 1,2-hydratase [Burkholderiaceae bacterium]|nr:carotenoid 1,2-hydratase [Burkholderiaceae bacterium]MEB2317683.1 carotenoid 1,2-hydratase [Pseudomonadota bacterium]